MLKQLLGGGSTRRAGLKIVEAMDGGQLFVVFQPLVRLHNGEIFAYETLLRCRSPEFQGPEAVLAAAVEARCVGRLGRLIRKMATEACPERPLFINIHPAELNEPHLVQPDDPMFMHDQPIHIEITESVPLTHFELCRSVLSEVRSKGIQVAIDDLGAGYSNLRYIADLKPEVVKLDRALVSGVTESERHRHLFRGIVALCTAMGALVVAEGIETVEELRIVREAGAHLGQGYLLARPGIPPPPVYWPADELPDAPTSASRR